LQLRIKKILSGVILPILLLVSISGCNFWNNKGRSNQTQNPENESEISANIPFSTKEPKNFQAEIIINSFSDEQKSTQKYFIARKAGNSRQTFYRGGEKQRSVLRTAENKTYLINHQTKTYRQLAPAKATAFSDDQLIKSLTSKWLNEKSPASFEKLNTEKGLTKYRVNFEVSGRSEIFIYVDEKLKLPVKQEFFSIRQNKKTLTYQMEIKNFKTEVADEVFELARSLNIDQ
jgi:hypothetical protein